MKRLMILNLVVLLAACSGNAIDDTILSGSWAIAGKSCADSAALLKFREGNLIGNNFGSMEPFFRILSAERKGGEVWIELKPVLARSPGETVGIVFRQDGDKLIGQRTFDGRDFSGNPKYVEGLTWTHCSA